MALLTRRAGLMGAAAILAALAASKLLLPEAQQTDSRPGPDLRPPADIRRIVPSAQLAPFTLHTLDGAPRTLADYAGQVVVMNFWATWCVPCVAELPELDRLAARGGMTVLAVSADRGGAAVVRPFAAAHGLTHATLLLDTSNDAVHALAIAGFPTTLIIGPDGRLHGSLEGPAAWSTAAPVIRAIAAAG